MGEVGAEPVEDRHEVVADDLDAGAAEAAEGLGVIGDVAVARGHAELDVVMDVDALDDLELQAGGLDGGLEVGDLLDRPHFADGHVEERADDTGRAGDLPHLPEVDAVVLFPEPTESHLHGLNGRERAQKVQARRPPGERLSGNRPPTALGLSKLRLRSRGNGMVNLVPAPALNSK